jgi:hypothetical protein
MGDGWSFYEGEWVNDEMQVRGPRSVLLFAALEPMVANWAVGPDRCCNEVLFAHDNPHVCGDWCTLTFYTGPWHEGVSKQEQVHRSAH